MNSNDSADGTVVKILVSTGEMSGDEMASAVIESLTRAAPGRFAVASLGGTRAARAGARNLLESSARGIVGLDDLEGYHRWAALFRRTLEITADDPPDIFIAFAHHAFNLPLAQRLKEQSRGAVRTMLVAPPELWAWDVNAFLRFMAPAVTMSLRLAGSPFAVMTDNYADRGRSSVRWFDRIACLFPLDARLYERIASDQGDDRQTTTVHHVGHPFYRYRDASVLAGLRRRGDTLRGQLVVDGNRQLLSIFPGSRSGVIDDLLPPMLDAVLGLTGVRDGSLAVGISAATPALERQIASILGHRLVEAGGALTAPSLVPGPADELLAASSFALTASGTITLRAACLCVPTVVASRTPASSMMRPILPWLFRRGTVTWQDGRPRPVPFTLPNVLLEEMVFAECVEKELRPRIIRRRLEEMFQAERPRQRLLDLHDDLFEGCLRGHHPAVPDGDPVSCITQLVLAEMESRLRSPVFSLQARSPEP